MTCIGGTCRKGSGSSRTSLEISCRWRTCTGEVRKRQRCPFRCGQGRAAERTGRESLLQIEGRVPELVTAQEMVTTESKMVAEELTEVTVKLNGARSDVAIDSFTRSATLYNLTTKHIYITDSQQKPVAPSA